MWALELLLDLFILQDFHDHFKPGHDMAAMPQKILAQKIPYLQPLSSMVFQYLYIYTCIDAGR